MGRWFRMLGLGLLLTLVVAVLLVALTRPGRTALKTALLVPQLVPSVPLKPQSWFSGDPERVQVKFPVASSTGMADIYRLPGGGKRAAVLLFLGVNPAGRDDPRVVNLGNALARAGFVVMIPWSETMTQRRLDTESPEDLVWAFQYLKGLEGVDSERLGLGGFCVGASMATVAAADPRISQDVKFLNFFGGYFNAEDFLAQIASRSSFYDSRVEPWSPDSLTLEVFTSHLIEGLESQHDREVLTRVHLEGEDPTLEELESLTPLGRTVHRLLQGDLSLDEARALMDQFPQEAKALLERISPSTYVDRLQGRVLIMHDREDNLVPSEESRRMWSALQQAGKDVYYTEFSFFQHMDPNRKVGPLVFVREAGKLYLHLYNILNITG